MNSRFTGNNVLIVEDETLLALMLEDLLVESGHRVVHAGSLPDAMAALDREPFDGDDVFPVAARLRELNTPFVFASASDAEQIGPEFQREQLIPKPYTIGQVQQSLSHMLASAGA
jgi:CheY-like chemotaxis protein